jgi:hypothetical protein
MNSKMIAKGNFIGDIGLLLSISFLRFYTVLNKISATASLTIPSPKMIENSFG